MDSPLVTIAIPFYNSEATLLDSIKSVFVQTYDNWELLLIDDGSLDGSLSIAESIKDSRVRVFSDGVNRGLVYRLNQIPKLANGTLLARMDSDDLMHPERISKQVSLFLEDQSVDLIDTGAYSVDQDLNPIGVRGLSEIRTSPKDVIRKSMLIHASILGKVAWFLNNPYDPEFIRAEDFELWCRTYKSSKFKRIKEPLYIIREGKVNVKNYLQSMETTRKIFRKYGPEVFESQELKAEIRKTYLKSLLYRTMGFFNCQDFLTKRRNEELPMNTKKELNSIINDIRKISL